MSRGYKILAIFFLAATIVVIAEIVYLFIFLPSSSKNTQKVSIYPSPTQTMDNLRIAPIASDSAFSENTIVTISNMLRTVKKDILVSSQMTNEYQGKLLAINKNPGIAYASDFAYEAALMLSLEGVNQQKNDLYYSKSAVEIIELTKIDNGIEKKLTIDDLKVGDEIKIQLTWDLTKDFSSFNIISLKVRVL